MADASIDLQATQVLFSGRPNFKAQTYSQEFTSSNGQVLDRDGNVSCERNILDIENVNNSAGYCGSDFKGDLTTLLTEFAGIDNFYAVTSLTINMSASEYATVDIEGHKHLINIHGDTAVWLTADVSSSLPDAGGFTAWDGFGIPSFGITTTNASPASATVTYSVNHIDQVKENGDHLVGVNTLCRAELSMDFSGVPNSPTIAGIEGDILGGWIVDSVDLSDSNSDFDTFNFTAHVHFDLA